MELMKIIIIVAKHVKMIGGMKVQILEFDEAEYSYSELSQLEQRAWELYIKEPSAGLDDVKFWQELPLYVQHIYLERVKYDKS